MEKKKKGKLWGWITSIIVIVLLIMAFSGAFNDKANEVTNGAFGDGSYEISATDKTTGKKVILKKGEKTVELSGYIDMSEEQIVKELGIEKNEYGVYPDDNNINFMCIDGAVYSISLNKIHDNGDSEYSLFNVKIGDNAGEVYDKIENEFDFISSDVIENGKRDSYVNKENGYMFAVDYSGLEITALSYVAENTGLAGDLETTEVDQEGVDAFVGEWTDSNSERANLQIVFAGNGVLQAEINWSSGADMNSTWTMSGKSTYDSERKTWVISYNDCKSVDTYYDYDADSYEEEIVYENGEGILYIEEGLIYWQDDNFDSSSECWFARNQ